MLITAINTKNNCFTALILHSAKTPTFPQNSEVFDFIHFCHSFSSVQKIAQLSHLTEVQTKKTNRQAKK